MVGIALFNLKLGFYFKIFRQTVGDALGNFFKGSGLVKDLLC
jgi:hypothetical protein